ncbi:hypothetical protein [Aestuariimicrobium sp. T2.26MG-19.2B]|uniref:hypothetical protein n=1 Tax=Aestuariimicrobium sp. T2.26MG-19.2B TaxID=3040679 RepID=UPI0024772F17|nr:hypothetical protein [Aestuariimicrobium sp. T2.26MG-19.2B]CAI9399598.1 hypothetical protein AESSP_00223 [Aestuariimicrobium sp. T2.26MG-19.2B]
MDGGGGWVVLLVVLGLVVAGLIVWGVLRARYVKSLRDKGWRFVTSPDVSIVHGLNVAPFGLGFNRRVDDQIIGRTSSGMPFQAFKYSASGVSAGDGYVVTMPLPRSLPEFHTFPVTVNRSGIRATEFSQDSGLRQIGHDAAWVRVAARALDPALRQLSTVTTPQLVVDHASLVGLGAPRQADQLQAYVEAMALGARELSAEGLARFQTEAPPPELSFYQHPAWIYRPRDDAALQSVAHTSGGSNHQAKDVMIATDGPIAIVALTHHWTTTRTVTESDGNGGTRTRTVTDHHSENLREFHPSFPFGEFKVNAGWFGNKREFESVDFNERFTVRAPDARFAHDIFHPRMMEWMLKVNPPPFEGADGRLTITCEHTVESMETARLFLLAFFGRVPRYVWQNLGLAVPPVPLVGSVEQQTHPTEVLPY